MVGFKVQLENSGHCPGIQAVLVYRQGRIWGEGVRTLPLSRVSTPCRAKGSPFGTFQEIHFWPRDPKIFLKAPWAPIYTNFEGGERVEKTRFFGQNFPKCLKTPFLDGFFNILPAAQKIWPKQGLNRAKGELEKSFWSTYKKNDKIFEIFLKIRSPRENPRSAPV